MSMLCALHGTVIDLVLGASKIQVHTLVTASAAAAQARDEPARSVRRLAARNCMFALACLALVQGGSLQHFAQQIQQPLPCTHVYCSLHIHVELLFDYMC